jgi:hypothetical protein
MLGQSDPSIPFDQLLGPYGLLVFLIIMFYVLGRFALRQIDDMRKERDYWRDKCLQLLETANSAVQTAVKLAPENDISDMAKVVDEARKRGKIP